MTYLSISTFVNYFFPFFFSLKLIWYTCRIPSWQLNIYTTLIEYIFTLFLRNIHKLEITSEHLFKLDHNTNRTTTNYHKRKPASRDSCGFNYTIIFLLLHAKLLRQNPSGLNRRFYRLNYSFPFFEFAVRKESKNNRI